MDTAVVDAAWKKEAWIKAETNSTLYELEATLRAAASLEERVAALGDAVSILEYLESFR